MKGWTREWEGTTTLSLQHRTLLKLAGAPESQPSKRKTEFISEGKNA